ncbi:MAG: type II toxin-antitoxin system RelE/ParE family toxin [Deltaproteobacteria bacterium]|nr:type II toxin-antitoxin system RelE/ParE family toxin [Deltaproteobacteria bacterium]
MKATFIELPCFQRALANYLDDQGFAALQAEMMANPTAGDVIKGTGGLRKLRCSDGRRGKGKRGGLRVICFWWETGAQFWLFAVYDKNEAADLTPDERKALKAMLKAELDALSQKKAGSQEVAG